MFVIIGSVVILGCLVAGFTMEGGKIPALIQPAELIIIAGAALGSLLIGNPPSVLTALLKSILGLLKPNPYNKTVFTRLLKMLYEISTQTRREGLMSLENHLVDPQKSAIFTRHPQFLANHHAVGFLSDGLRLIVDGITPFALDELMEADLEARRTEEHRIPGILSKTGDAMPGFGIVAAVMGVVITMSFVGGEAEVIGEKVGAALVGTFLGVLLCYGFFQPLSQACEGRGKSEEQYMMCIRAGLLGIARGDTPLMVADFARRSIEPSFRCSFDDLEKAIKEG